MAGKKDHQQLNLSLEEKLFTIVRKQHQQSHIKLQPQVCKQCLRRICLSICPAGAYLWDEQKQQIQIRHEDCLECGTCWIACEMQNIEWSNPVGGSGISYRNS